MNKKALISKIFKIMNWFPIVNRISCRGCTVKLNNSILIGCRITSKGRNNEIVIEDGILQDCRIAIFGNNNKVILKQGVHANSAEIHIEDDNNSVVVGERTMMAGKIHFACTEGTNITVGSDCLFSSDIVFRTGDSHTITNLEGTRINPAKDILIKNRVWLGHRVLVNKGVVLCDDTVVGTGAIVTKPFEEQNVIIAGVPAKIVKREVKWISARI